jgi:alpha-ribazole phosphatase
MTNLLFIRHAETDLAGTFCGHSDPPLNDRGRTQLSSLNERLRFHPIDVLYASDLQRAVQTAEAIGKARNVAIDTTPALREIDFGDWEGLTWEAIEERDPAYAARWVAEFPNLPTPNGEPIALFRERILNEVTRLRHEAANANIAAVTHGGVLRILLEELGLSSAHHAWERTREYTCILHCTQIKPNGPLVIHP